MKEATEPLLVAAGRRLADTINNHLLVHGQDVAGKWVAARLLDGVSDGVIYDTKADAVRHQFHEQLCAYVMILPDGITPKGASTYLFFTRQLYDAGYRLQDPQQHIHMPMDTKAPRERLLLPPRRRHRRN